jgi:hypothetical protein
MRLSVVLSLTATLLLACGIAHAEGNLLSGKSPLEENGVRRSALLSDVQAGREGDYGRTDATARFEEGSSFVVDDLKSASSEQRVRNAILLFGLTLVLLVLLAHRGAELYWMGPLAILPVAAGYVGLVAFRDAFPVESQTVSLARATVAFAAAVAVLRECFPPVRYPPHRGAVLITLGLCGILGFLCFYNLGQPPFRDNRLGQSTFVHYPDLRQHYPTARYFPEIGYRGLYLADMAAYREENDANREAIDRLPIRDLGTPRMSSVGDKQDEMQAIRQRFTPERWAAYKRDARYFREVMGTPDYLDTMRDLGVNATPVWMGIATLLFNRLDPSNRAFLFTATFDLVLLLLMFAMVGRTFGLRTLFVSMAIFGASDFIMYGTTWAGATLRHDWLAYLGLAACAIKRGHFLLGGVLLGLATMIQAFAALTLVAVTLPALWRLHEGRRAAKPLPSWRAIYQQHRPTGLILLGGFTAIVGLFAFSVTLLPVRAWADWLHRMVELSSDPHPSHLGLRSLIAGWESNQPAILRARLPLFVAAILFFLGMIAVAARGKRPEQAMLLGLLLTPVLLYPGNDYIHFVFLLPLLCEERAVGSSPEASPLSPTGGRIWATLLFMCVANYWTVLVPDLALHFHQATAVLFAGLTAILVFLVRERTLATGWLRPAT